MAQGLEALEARVAQDLALIEVPLRPWVPERLTVAGKPLTDVVIAGAGLSGLSIAFGLRRQGVERVLLIDAAVEGREGPWVTSARMRSLRSPKTLSGPDLGVPSLTFRAWHEAVHGEAAWQGFERIRRQDWMAYLAWFRRVTGLAVRNGTRLTGIGGGNISGGAAGLRLVLEQGGIAEKLDCRRLVLATGIEGAGGFAVPAIVAESLPRDRWTHSAELTGPARFAGLDVAVVGAAASAFDWAVTALEAGARSVTLLARAAALPRTEVLDWSNFPGFLNHFADLGDRQRYRFTRAMAALHMPPTQEMYDCAMAHPQFRLLTGAALTAAAMRGDRVVLHVLGQEGEIVVDHLLLGTGYTVDLALRPECAGFAHQIALWRDRFTPDIGEDDAALLGYPYLGPAFELTERVPGSAPFLRHIHLFNNAALPSLGPVCNGITGLKSGVPKLVAGLTRSLFTEDADLHLAALCAYDKAHFNPHGRAP